MEEIKTAYSVSSEDITHHGILGMRWGARNGPPYPLDEDDHSRSEEKAGWEKSLDQRSEAVKAKRKQHKEEMKRIKAENKMARKEAKEEAREREQIRKENAKLARDLAYSKLKEEENARKEKEKLAKEIAEEKKKALEKEQKAREKEAAKEQKKKDKEAAEAEKEKSKSETDRNKEAAAASKANADKVAKNYDKNKLSGISDEELQKAINRIRLEESYDALRSNNITDGAPFLKKSIANAATKSVNDFFKDMMSDTQKTIYNALVDEFEDATGFKVQRKSNNNKDKKKNKNKDDDEDDD